MAGFEMDSYEFMVLAAEQSIRHTELDGISAARALVRRARGSAWFRGSFPDIERVRVREVDDGIQGWIRSSAGGDTRWLPTCFTINMHPAMLNDIVVLHELAHVAAPRYVPDLKRIKKGHLPATTVSHGPEFTAMLSELVRRFGMGDNHADLQEAYGHFGVQVGDLETVIASRAISDQVEAIYRDWSLEIREIDREQRSDAVAQGVPPPWVPVLRDIPWGWWLTDRRRYGQGNRFGRDALAARISRVEPCKARDIRAIEDSSAPPTDMRLRRIALASAAAIGLDPVWVRTALGLARWNCAIELEELDVVAPDWAATVRHMNALIAGRPPYWQIEAPR